MIKAIFVFISGSYEDQRRRILAVPRNGDTVTIVLGAGLAVRGTVVSVDHAVGPIGSDEHEVLIRVGAERFRL